MCGFEQRRIGVGGAAAACSKCNATHKEGEDGRSVEGHATPSREKQGPGDSHT